MSIKYDYLMLLTELKHEQNNDTIKLAREYVKEIYEILDDIVKTRILDNSIDTAYKKLKELKSILIEEDYWQVLKIILKY